jgi:ATP-dependent DNA ligase
LTDRCKEHTRFMPLRPHALPTGFIAPCLPTNAPQPPSGEEWVHEIKHDGFRVIARKEGKRVKLYSRPGTDLKRRDSRYSFGLLAALDQEQESECACGKARGRGGVG